jgi:hypothetical protein
LHPVTVGRTGEAPVNPPLVTRRSGGAGPAAPAAARAGC